jgi:hypothetical protein
MDEKQIVNRFLESIRRLQLRMTRSVSKSIMLRAIYFFILYCLLITPDGAEAQPFWSVGPKLGYAFGDHGGVTIGAEASYFPNFANSIYPYGFTFDITRWHDHFSIHIGAETWFLIGIDIGPTLFFSSQQVNFGMSLIGWDGYFLYPYYEMGIPFTGEIYHGVGGYLKFPVGIKSYSPAWGPIGSVG